MHLRGFLVDQYQWVSRYSASCRDFCLSQRTLWCVPAAVSQHCSHRTLPLSAADSRGGRLVRARTTQKQMTKQFRFESTPGTGVRHLFTRRFFPALISWLTSLYWQNVTLLFISLYLFLSKESFAHLAGTYCTTDCPGRSLLSLIPLKISSLLLFIFGFFREFFSPTMKVNLWSCKAIKD